MSMFSMKYNEEEMYEVLRGGLRPGETLLAAVYATFTGTGFLNGGSTSIGYIGLTDQDRLIGIQSGMVSSSPFSAELGFLRRLKCKKGLLGMRSFELDNGEIKLKASIPGKVGGGKFPNQPENQKLIMDTLEAKQ